MEPGTALAQAFKGFLTDRPLHQCEANFLHGLQLHRDYCNQKGFSIWAGKGHVFHNKVGLLGENRLWLLTKRCLGFIASISDL